MVKKISENLPLNDTLRENHHDSTSFERHVRFVRFSGTGVFERVCEIIRSCQNTKLSKIVLLHSTFPQEHLGPIMESGSVSQENPGIGDGCGKSDLIRLIEHEYGKNREFTVTSFVNNRDNAVEGVNFYEDIFLPEVIKRKRIILPHHKRYISAFSIFLNNLFKRLLLLIHVATRSFVAILVYVLTFLGFKSVEFFANPIGQTLLDRVSRFVDANQNLFLFCGAVLLIWWIFDAFGKIRSDEKLLVSWNSMGIPESANNWLRSQTEILTGSPERILRFFSKRHVWLLLVDDIDVMDANSFTLLMNLFERAQGSSKYALCLVLTCNPRNPMFSRPERRPIWRKIEAWYHGDAEGEIIELHMPKYEELLTWLLQYTQTLETRRILSVLRRRYPSLSKDTGLLLSFFVKLDQKTSLRELDSSFDETRIAEEFESFLNRDKRVAQDIVGIIERKENGQEILEVLKYVLAFKRQTVRVDHLQKILQRNKLSISRLCEKVLLGDDIDLLKKVHLNGLVCYQFRYPYLRTVLDTDWKEWRRDASSYYTRVFEGLNQVTRSKDDPELAFDAEPSKLAIDVLFRAAEYHHRYYGATDAAYALRFCGLDRGGALGKWRQLTSSALENGEDLQGLISWSSQARYNPLRYWSGEVYPIETYAPELVLTAGRLYWMSGDFKTAEYVLAILWPEIKENLAATSERLTRTDLEIRATLAEMYYAVGEPGYWDNGRDICMFLRDEAQNDGNYTPILLLSLMRHYREVGVGNEHLPLRFLSPQYKFDSLEKTCADIPSNTFERLPALYVLADAIWQALVKFPHQIPATIQLEEITHLEVDHALLDKFTDIIKQLSQSIHDLRQHRTTQRKQAILRGRVGEGDLLRWESMLLFLRFRHFSLVSRIELGRYADVLNSTEPSKFPQRRRIYVETARSLQRCLCACERFGPLPDRFYSIIDRLETLMGEGTGERVGDESTSRRYIEKLYYIGCDFIKCQAQQRFRMAEAIYQQLGCTQGIAATKFMQAVLSFSTWQPSITDEMPEDNYSMLHPIEYADAPKTPEWVETFERYFRYSHGELGYTLDEMRGHLLLADWASSHDLYAAVLNYQFADKWTQPEGLGLPTIYDAETNLQIGRCVGNMENAPFSDSYTFEVFDKAASSLDKLEETPSYIEYPLLNQQRLDIHWWLAELSSRQAERESNLDDKKRLMARAIAECNFVANRAQKDKRYAGLENLARLVKGRVLGRQGDFLKGFHEIERAFIFFDRNKDIPNKLQALVALVHLVEQYHETDAGPKWLSCIDNTQRRYYPALFETVAPLLPSATDFTPTYRIITFRAGHICARQLWYRGALDDRRLAGESLRAAKEWYGYLFRILESLGLYGAAILLDHEMRPVLEMLNDTESLNQHKQRLLNAARLMDPSREKIPFPQISSILRSYASVLFDDTVTPTSKQDCIVQARHALGLSPPEIQSAATILEQGLIEINEHDPLPIDLEMSELALNVNAQLGLAERVSDLAQKVARMRDIMQSRDFLQLADYYRDSGGDYVWALQIACKVQYRNEYSQRAKAQLPLVNSETELDETLALLEDDHGGISDRYGSLETGVENLMDKPPREFSTEDCAGLLMVLERNLRDAITERLSGLTPRWWKQRVPQDVRVGAEKRKRERETTYPGLLTQDLPVTEYLDFSDYIKIITMRSNWDEAFSSVFENKDFVCVKLREVHIVRNDIAHSRPLPVQDREIFVVTARQIISALLQREIPNEPMGPAETVDEDDDL